MTEPPSCRARHRATAAQLALSVAALTAVLVADGWAAPALVAMPLCVAVGWGFGYDHLRRHLTRRTEPGETP